MTTAVAHAPLTVTVEIQDGTKVVDRLTTVVDVCEPGTVCWSQHAPGAVARRIAKAWADDHGRTVDQVSLHAAWDVYVAHLADRDGGDR